MTGDARESRKVVLIMGMTLDGFGAGGWTPSATFELEEVQEEVRHQMKSIDTFLFGRTSYEIWHGYWPGAAEDPDSSDFAKEFSRLTDAIQKVVYSRSLSAATWQHSRIVSGSIAEDVAQMKRAKGRDLAIVGGPRIASAFGALGLIDEYRLWIHPTIQGEGTRLLAAQAQARDLEFLDVKAFGPGGLCLHLRRKES